MIFHITLVNSEGIMLEQSLDLPITDDATYEQFMQLASVKELLLMNPTMTILDVTPDGMPDWFSDGDMMLRQLTNFGIKAVREPFKQTVYEEL
jgi:hypothetical protein